MARENTTAARAVGRPLAALGAEVAGLAALATVAFFIELLVRWAAQ